MLYVRRHRCGYAKWQLHKVQKNATIWRFQTRQSVLIGFLTQSWSGLDRGVDWADISTANVRSHECIGCNFFPTQTLRDEQDRTKGEPRETKGNQGGQGGPRSLRICLQRLHLMPDVFSSISMLIGERNNDFSVRTPASKQTIWKRM